VRIPESWLRQFCDPPIGTEELAERLTMGGLEVESIEPVAPPFSGVVVARVASVGPHPNADRLKLCEVDVGAGVTARIVCGAPNVAAGQLVPCALPGAELPGGVSIGATTVRGVASAGMLCSARELGLSEEHEGLLLLGGDARVGQPLREALALDERCLEIKLTPNRGDCLSVYGVARELAALTGTPLRRPAHPAVAPSMEERLAVAVEAPDLCGRFSGRVLRGLNARAATPAWMRQRLERSGLRSISALVDISNYVMLELGRPTHVFDLKVLQGPLTVRWAREGERIELLNGREVRLDPRFGVITDGRGAQSLAGLMGGQSTAITLDTTDIYLEAAFWWPEAIQGRARLLNFSTDAAHRFERGVDFDSTVDHIEAITRTILEVCGTPHSRVGPVDDQAPRLPAREPVRLRADRCRKVLGTDLSDRDMAQVFERLDLRYERREGAFLVQPPSYRFDLQIEEDLIEEVARVVGYERIGAHPPRAAVSMVSAPESVRHAHELRRRMAEAGYQELINYSFVDPAWEADLGSGGRPIAVINPIAAQHAVMRSTLFGGLVATLKYNLNIQASRARLFEVGRVFRSEPGRPEGPLDVAGVAQPTMLGALCYGSAEDEQWGVRSRPVDFFDLKGDLQRIAFPLQVRFAAARHGALHPGRSARIRIGGVDCGWIGQLHPRWSQKYGLPGAAVLFELDVAALQALPLPSAAPVPEVPAVVRDLAFWVPDLVQAQQVFDEIARLSARDSRLAVLREVKLFDLFQPEPGAAAASGKAPANTLLNKEKSLAFRIVLQDTRRSLSDSDADAACGAIVDHLAIALGARVRQ
jgi:phenylalanyl-tRNA synthetase beta chain